ncbi:mitochondrial outer membrane protein SLC25A46-like isoform X2 [Centruroides vittatus]
MYYHLTPFTLFPIMVKLERRQGIGTLWKGGGSIFIVRGLSVAAETALSEVTALPREVTWHSSLKQLSQHLILKGCTYAFLTPFFYSSLVETVQSEIASEKPGVLDCLKEGLCRVFRWGTPQSARMLPIWFLIVPTALHGILNYTISSLVKSVLSWILTVNLKRRQEKLGIANKGGFYAVDQQMCQITAAFAGNLVADVVLYPSETVLHRLYLQGTRTIIDNLDTGTSVTPVISTYQGVFDCFHTIVQEEGAAGLYKGFGALILQYSIYGMLLKITRMLILQVNCAFNNETKRQD